MSRIVVLCEGETEEIALKYFIARQWRAEGSAAVGLHSINLDGKLQSIGKYAVRYLDDPDVAAIFTLIDLQGMGQVTHEVHDALDRKVERVRDWLRVQLRHSRADHFFPHVCVHQTEAWILAEGRALAERLRDRGLESDPNAELKNFENPPAARLNQLFLRSKRRRYQKIIDGRPLFEAMEFQPVYSSCRYFRALYNDLKIARG